MFFGKEEHTHYFVGLDFGLRSDPTALAIIERFEARGRKPEFRVRHLQRWPLNTGFDEIVTDVKTMLDRHPLATTENPVTLAMDATGVGLPIADQVRRAGWKNVICRSIIITGGSGKTANPSGWTVNVPKRDLVSVVQIGLQTGRLKIAAELPEAQALRTELENFKVTITEAKNDTYEGRQGVHDDLVLAVAMAMWSMRHLLHTSVFPKSEAEKLEELLPAHLHWQNIEKMPPEQRDGLIAARQYQTGVLRRQGKIGPRSQPGDFDHDPFTDGLDGWSSGHDWGEGGVDDIV